MNTLAYILRPILGCHPSLRLNGTRIRSAPSGPSKNCPRIGSNWNASASTWNHRSSADISVRASDIDGGAERNRTAASQCCKLRPSPLGYGASVVSFVTNAMASRHLENPQGLGSSRNNPYAMLCIAQKSFNAIRPTPLTIEFRGCSSLDEVAARRLFDGDRSRHFVDGPGHGRILNHCINVFPGDREAEARKFVGAHLRRHNVLVLRCAKQIPQIG